MKRAASTARTIIALVLLVLIAGAIALVLANKNTQTAVILSRELTPPTPDLARHYPPNHMLLIAEIRNDAPRSAFLVEGIVHTGDGPVRESTTIDLDRGQTRRVILDFGPLTLDTPEVEYEVRVTPR